jgi:flagellar motility protein MotE (MotC chaperone)
MKRLLWMLGMTAFFAAVLLTVFAEAEEGTDSTLKKAPEGSVSVPTTANQTDSASASASATESGVCLGDPAAIEDLKHRREELEARKAQLDARENELKTREKALDEQLAKIEQVRDDVEKIDGARKKENDEKVAKLVETIQTMSPKAASALLGALDETLAVATMARMDTPRLAKIMNLVDAAKAARLTEILAGVVRARNITNGALASNKGVVTPSLGGVETTKDTSSKGGDKYDGQNKQ